MKATITPDLVGLWLAVVLVTGCSSPAPREPSKTSSAQAALEEGNRLFHAGQVDEAITAYLQGTTVQSPDSTLLYNLGTALHHAGRLPEAILWYRRAAGSGHPTHLEPVATGNPGPPGQSTSGRASDPWLAENLWLARRGLGSRILPPSRSWLIGHTGTVKTVAVLLAWLTLLVVIAGERLPKALTGATASLALLLFGGAAAIEHWGPQPAVILEDCVTPAGELPAGTEIWVLPHAGGWKISGVADMNCPAAAVAPVFVRSPEGPDEES